MLTYVTMLRRREGARPAIHSGFGMVVILMGVSGAGKTRVGKLLASQLGWLFADADDYHSAASVEKMRNGVALTDADRAPWLESLRGLLAGWIAAGKNGVVACSALKQEYRDGLVMNDQVRLVYLKADWETLRRRLHERRGHYMKEGMLDSQIATLEEPQDAIAVNADRAPEDVVRAIRRLIE